MWGASRTVFQSGRLELVLGRELLAAVAGTHALLRSRFGHWWGFPGTGVPVMDPVAAGNTHSGPAPSRPPRTDAVCEPHGQLHSIPAMSRLSPLEPVMPPTEKGLCRCDGVKDLEGERPSALRG